GVGEPGVLTPGWARTRALTRPARLNPNRLLTLLENRYRLYSHTYTFFPPSQRGKHGRSIVRPRPEERPFPDREAIRQGRHHAAGRGLGPRRARHLQRGPEPGHRPGRPGLAARPHHRDLRSRIERQDDRGPARRGPGPEAGRRRSL